MIDTAPDYLVEQMHRDLCSLFLNTDTAARDDVFSRLTDGINALAQKNLKLTEENRTLRDRAQQDEKECSAVLEAMVQQVLVYDNEGRVIRANRAAFNHIGPDLIGLTGEDIIRRTDLRTSDRREAFIENLQSTRALRGEIVDAERMDAVDRAGAHHNVLVSASPLIHDGRTLGAVAVWQDITGLVRTIKGLDEDRAWLQAIIDCAPEAILVADTGTRTQMINRAAEEICSPSCGKEHTIYYGMNRNPCEPVALSLARVGEHGESITGMERVIVLPDGRRREILMDGGVRS